MKSKVKHYLVLERYDMEKNQTAVEWLLEKLRTEWGIAISDNVTNQAKEMESKQMLEQYDKGYHNALNEILR